jgi:hypothetical protein
MMQPESRIQKRSKIGSNGRLADSSSQPIESQRPIRFSRIVVGVLLFWAVLDVAGRFGPIQWLSVLPELAAARQPGFLHPFTPNMIIHDDHWIGETAVTGNLPPAEFRAPVIFSTDKFGFRLTPNVLSQPKIDFLLTGGASFAYGGGLSDDETFPAVLTREEKLPTYNAGRFYWDSTHFIYVSRLMDRLHAQSPSAVIYLYWENVNPPLDVRQLDPLPWRIDGPGKAAFGESRYAALRETVQYDKRYLTAISSVSPLEVLSTRFFKMLGNGRILPNRYAAAVASRVLPNGDRILFLQTEVQRVLDPPSDDLVRQQADFFAEYARRLADLNTGLYIILLPDKYSLYGEFVDGSRAAPALPYLNRLEAELSRRRLRVLNGLSVLQPLARADIQSGELSYYRDDHHWSPKGVRRIAAAFAQFVRAQSESRPERTNAIQ